MVPIGFRSWRLSVVSPSDSRSWSANERSPILLSIFSFFGTQHSAHHWAINMFATFIAIGVYVFIAQYLPLVLGLSPLQAGLWTLPWAFSFIVGSNLTPPIACRVSPVSSLTSGLLISAVGFTIITQVTGPSHFVIFSRPRSSNSRFRWKTPRCLLPSNFLAV